MHFQFTVFVVSTDSRGSYLALNHCLVFIHWEGINEQNSCLSIPQCHIARHAELSTPLQIMITPQRRNVWMDMSWTIVHQRGLLCKWDP